MSLTRKEFEEYEDQFNNAPDKSEFFDRYYSAETEFIHPFKGTFRGKDELVDFWNAGKNSGHEGIHEILHLKNFLPSGDAKLAVELLCEWRCFEDTDYLGPRKAGDVFWGKCAAFYDFDESNLISRVQVYLNLLDGEPGSSASEQ